MNPKDLVLILLVVATGLVFLRTMIQSLQRTPKEDLMKLIQQGAQVVDVRSPQEFAQAHVRGSRNIPLNQLLIRAIELDRDKPIVVCCASGARSSVAKDILERAGFPSVHNAGPWQSLSTQHG